MLIHYDESTVNGYKQDEKGRLRLEAQEKFIHRRQQDPILMACKRSCEMAGCERITVNTRQAFVRWVDVEPHKGRKDIPAIWVPEYEY